MQERPKAGRKVDLSRSRKEQRTPRAPKEPKEPKEKRRVTFWGVLGRLIATVVCLCIIGGSLLAVGAVYYVVNATADDGNLLDLDNIELSQSSVVMATDPDPGKVLETGIDIFAQPPGKKLVNLTALSGGERSMTAVALLFATYMVKASPFCILDEIDAALDDRNIGNFLAVLQGFAEKSQFIIITHNKHTVLGSSSMLGVTQIEAGVSTTVSYKLARVEGKPVIMDAENKTVDFTADGKRK